MTEPPQPGVRQPPDVSRYAVSLGGQFRDKLPYLLTGGLLLLGLQAFMAKRDFLVRDAVDAAVGLRAADARHAALLILAVSVGAAIVRVLSRVAIFTAGRNVEYELRALLLDRLQKLGPSFFRKVATGEIMSRATNDLAQVRLLLGFGALNIFGSTFALTSALYVMFSASWKLSLASLVNLPLLAFVTRFFSSRMFVRTRENQEAIGKMSDRVLASLAGIRVVRAFGLVPSEKRFFDEANEVYLQRGLALARLRGSMGPIMGALGAVGVLVTFWYGGVLLDRKELSPGEFVAFWLALVRLTWPLLALGFVASIIQRGRAGYERLRTIFDAVPEIVSGPLERTEPVRGALSVKGLTFVHGTRKVLDGVSFDVPAGSSVAIVGRTGSGKSTLASLLPRLLPTPEGAVLLDGDDVCALPLERVRGSIGYAQQDAFLFSTTVARNIGYALPDPDAGHAEVRAAAAEASVLDEILHLPDGFDTVVGERGVQLSGGQRQRVALARALLRGAPVLVLDDPLSAVDAKTEAAILAAIERQRALRTVVLVTHRIAAARGCDQIVVLDEGKVVEQGTHDELVARGGIYAAFAEEQALEAELASAGTPERSPSGRAPKEEQAAPVATAEADAGARRRTDEVMARFHEEGAVQTYDAKNLRKLWPYLRPERSKMALSLVLLVAASFLALGRPLVMRGGLDAALEPGGLSRVVTAGIMLTALIVVEQSVAFPQMYLMQLAGARGMANLRRAVFSFLHTRSLTFFDRRPVGRLVTRVTNDVDAIGEMFSSGALNAFGDLLRLAMIVTVMVSLDWQMSLIAFAALPPVMLFVNWTRRRMRDAFREIRVKTARMNAYLNEQVSGMSIVQAYAHEGQAAAEFDAVNEGYRQANNRSIVYDASLDAAIEMIASLCIASALWFAGNHDASAPITFGTLFAFIAYIEMFFVPIRDLSTRYTLVQGAMTGAERVFELLGNEEADAPSAGRAPPAETAPDADAPAIEFADVTFSYKPGVPVLSEVSFSARQGERIALVGATGAGKSTVASLLLRLYEHGEGVIRVEGRDVLDWDTEALRARFAVVPQEVFLFPGTVAGNVAAGDETPDVARVSAALDAVGALDLFERREGGLEAAVAERGANFSAGERQLIAFARAIYRDPPMLVLDEATANVDSDTEARLQRAVERTMAGRTCLVIAHRLSTIRAADRIVVFHRGRVVEQGSHDELLREGGVYAKLHALQFAKDRVAA